MRLLPLKNCWVTGVTIALYCSLVFANDSRVILPESANDNLELLLQHDIGDELPSNYLEVFVGEQTNCCSGKSAVAGRYFVENRKVTFEPAFEFILGQSYTVVSRSVVGSNHGTTQVQEFSIEPSEKTVRPSVVGIYPSGDTLPENTLRFYIHFSTPMQPHLTTKFIRLLDAEGKSDTAAFMNFKQELWSKDRKRLTLLMDPGRIKRGVAQNMRLGPALVEGNRFSIVVKEGWPSANGDSKASRFEKRFLVSERLSTLPQIDHWQISVPHVLTQDPIIIDFDRPFDRVLAQHAINIIDQNGKPIQGTVSLQKNEEKWIFMPQETWLDTTVQLVVDTRLEDVAGNNLKELLDKALPINPDETKNQDLDATTQRRWLKLRSG